MTNQNNRPGSNDDQPAEPERRHESGGHIGAGRSGEKSLGSEKPEERDDMGSKRPED